MKKALTLAEARKFFNEEHVYETETGFLVNEFGKYCPNITFVIGKEFELNAEGKVVNPLRYIVDHGVTDNMNMNFDGSPKFMFGDFWRSKKGGACFRPKDPMKAKDLLIEVAWGGPFNRTRGRYPDEAKAIEGVKYFRHATSNGGGVGYDYWVVPVGFHRALRMDEIDRGEVAIIADHAAMTAAYREKHSRLQREKAEANDKALKAKLAAEAASREERDNFIPRLEEINRELDELRKPKEFLSYAVKAITFDEEYFKLGSEKYLYGEEGLKIAEGYLSEMQEWIPKREEEERAKVYAQTFFRPRFEELRGQVEKIGWELSYYGQVAYIKPRNDARIRREYPFDMEGLEKFRFDVEQEVERVAEEEAKRANRKRIYSLLSTTAFPEGLWYIFAESEELDSAILAEVEAIIAASRAEKDELDMHELCACGFDRRCNAIWRVLRRVGGGKALPGLTKDKSLGLARFIAGRY